MDYFLPVWQITLKEVRSFFQSHLGWATLFLSSLIAGLYGYFIIKSEPASNSALQGIFYRLGGINMIAALAMSMRLFAEEHALGTLELLITSPIT